MIGTLWSPQFFFFFKTLLVMVVCHKQNACIVIFTYFQLNIAVIIAQILRKSSQSCGFQSPRIFQNNKKNLHTELFRDPINKLIVALFFTNSPQ